MSATIRSSNSNVRRRNLQSTNIIKQRIFLIICFDSIYLNYLIYFNFLFCLINLKNKNKNFLIQSLQRAYIPLKLLQYQKIHQ